jgi:hypothetical protein
MAKKAALVVVSLAVIGACAWYLLGRSGGVPREELKRVYVCDACEHRFKALPGEGPVVCPKCKAEQTARIHVYECKACGERFEGFRERERGGTDAPPIVEHKRPGGQWTRVSEALGPIACPKCRSRNVEAVARPSTTTAP